MRILLTDTHSLLGHSAARLLLDKGLTVKAPADPALPPHPRLEPCDLDLEDPHQLTAQLQGCQAALYLVHRAPQDMAAALRQTRHLLQACHQAHVRRLLATFPATVLGTGPEPVDEQSDYLPGDTPSPWDDALWAMEAEVLAANSPRLPTTTLLTTALMGPEDPHLEGARLLLDLARGLLPLLPEASLALTDARDVARAHLEALHRGRPGQRYLLGAPATSLHEIATLVAQHRNQPAPPRTRLSPRDLPAALQRAAPLLRRAGARGQALEALLWQLQSLPAHTKHHKAQAELDYKPRHARVTLKDTLAWLDQQDLW